MLKGQTVEICKQRVEKVLKSHIFS